MSSTRAGVDASTPSDDGTRVDADERADDVDRGSTGEPATPERDALLRALADLDNVRKRFAREVQRERTEAAGRATIAWLPVLDDLERAVEHLGTSAGDDDGLVSGVRAIVDKARNILAEQGFQRDDEVGVPFDAARHDAVAVVEAPDPAGSVIAIVEPGYRSADTTLRPAKVVVAKARS
ncbi:MAG: heat shock protein GrpE [Ilumatobacteraceae bacterium]|jgi:molecular chaperone GrpE|nr:heat shock protein GrpE [Ilumatobacteraceae bacterium]